MAPGNTVNGFKLKRCRRQQLSHCNCRIVISSPFPTLHNPPQHFQLLTPHSPPTHFTLPPPHSHRTLATSPIAHLANSNALWHLQALRHFDSRGTQPRFISIVPHRNRVHNNYIHRTRLGLQHAASIDTLTNTQRVTRNGSAGAANDSLRCCVST